MQTSKEKLEHIDMTEETVLEKLLKLKPSKMPGPDRLHPRLVLETEEVTAALLSVIFPTSLEIGEVPTD